MQTLCVVALCSLLLACSDAQERADPLLHPDNYAPLEDASIDASASWLDAGTLPQADAALDGAAR